MLVNREESALLFVDIQEKLTPLVMNSKYLIEKCMWISQLVQSLKIPCLVSEQYPKGLGKTLPILQNSFREHTLIEKVHFSCYPEASFMNAWKPLAKKQIVLAGIETHVCVLQTAIDLQEAGYDVFVVVDAVSSRYQMDHDFGLKRMQQHGIQLITSEMLFFEWVERAATAEFKELSLKFLPRNNG